WCRPTAPRSRWPSRIPTTRTSGWPRTRSESSAPRAGPPRRLGDQREIDAPPADGHVLDADAHLVAQAVGAAAALGGEPQGALVELEAVPQALHADHPLDERLVGLDEQPEVGDAGDRPCENLAHAIAHEHGAVDVDDLALGLDGPPFVLRALGGQGGQGLA